MPTGRKEKKESGSSPAEVNVFCITRFGGVPIKHIKAKHIITGLLLHG
jgi:hypothetical protein